MHPENHGKPWTQEDLRKIADLWMGDIRLISIAQAVGRKPDAVFSKLNNSPYLGGYLDTYAMPNQRLEYMRNCDFLNPLKWKDKTMDVTDKLAAKPDPSDIYLMMMLQEDYTTCEVTFGVNPKRYTYRTRLGLKKDDYVVVYTGSEYNVAQVVEVHDEPKIDPDRPMLLKWIVQKVDHTSYDEQAKLEKDLLEELMKNKRSRAKQAARDLLAIRFPEGSPERAAIEALLAKRIAS